MSQERIPESTEDVERHERLDAIFDLLRSRRRRALLYFVSHSGTGTFPVETVVEEVREYERSASRATELPPRQAVRTSLVHWDFPRLAAVGVLEYDPRRGEVHVHGLDPVEPWLEQARDFELG